MLPAQHLCACSVSASWPHPAARPPLPAHWPLPCSRPSAPASVGLPLHHTHVNCRSVGLLAWLPNAAVPVVMPLRLRKSDRSAGEHWHEHVRDGCKVHLRHGPCACMMACPARSQSVTRGKSKFRADTKGLLGAGIIRGFELCQRTSVLQVHSNSRIHMTVQQNGASRKYLLRAEAAS